MLNLNNKLPTITTITPSLNRAKFIDEAIKSVLNQDYPHVEHIIIDGGSTDGTLDVLALYPNLKVISEPDQGIYDAINKGIRMAKGDIIGILNSDDYYEPNFFSELAEIFHSNQDIDAIVGGIDILKMDASGSWKPILVFPTINYQNFWYRITIGSPNTNGWFIRKRFFDQIGMYNLNYPSVSDRDFILRMAFSSVNYFPFDKLIYHYRIHSNSITLDGSFDGEAEFIFELRNLVEDYINSSKIHFSTKKYLFDWHSDIISSQTIAAIRKNKIRRATFYAMYGCRINPKWPYHFLRRILLAIIRRIIVVFNPLIKGSSLVCDH